MSIRTLLTCITITAASLATSGIAQAQTLANNMTCEQAQRAFERTGRVYMRSRLGPVLPIYGGVPIAESGRLRCDPFTGLHVQTVITRDKKSCAISARCLSD